MIAPEAGMPTLGSCSFRTTQNRKRMAVSAWFRLKDCDTSLVREAGQQRLELRGGEFSWLAHVVMEDNAAVPIAVGISGV